MLPDAEREAIVRLVAAAKACFDAHVPDDAIEDLAFVGNASGHYDWEPSRLVDLDVCLFVRRKDEATGARIAALRDELTRRLAAQGADVEARLIVGPYKPPLERIERPFIFVHLAVFTAAEYAEGTLGVMRWAWRKYVCKVDRMRLREAAPPRVTVEEAAARTVRLLDRLRDGRTTMVEWLLPGFTRGAVEVTADAPNFAEVCFSAVANCTRHHARALGHGEADTLANAAFFAWYARETGMSGALLDLAALKDRSRDEGFGAVATDARRLAIVCLEDLARRIGP